MKNPLRDLHLPDSTTSQTHTALTFRLPASAPCSFDSMIAVDTIAVENEAAGNMDQGAEPDWPICSKPPEYAQLILSGDLASMCRE